jgi:hypothetical protein
MEILWNAHFVIVQARIRLFWVVLRVLSPRTAVKDMPDGLRKRMALRWIALEPHIKWRQ